ncbi:MAG: YggS family pyridoxal phosphate-dependent enzyme [Steroidobacteraceae bacterium]
MLIAPQNLPDGVRRVRDRIAAAARQCGRNVDSVTLLAVSKSQPVAAIEAAREAGLEHFGESYVQEALPKIDALRGRDLTWHFIGRIQSNKTRAIAESFAWVHAVDRVRIAERLAVQRPYHAPPLNVCIHVNVAGEASKGGVTVEAAPKLIADVAALPRLQLRGLMCMLPEGADTAQQRRWFAKVRELHERANASGARLDTLSMGMSADLEAAVCEGATIVRVGTALFGPRPAAGTR